MKLKISIVLILAAFSPLNCLANTNVQARFEQSLKDAVSLTNNYEVHWLDNLYLPDPANGKWTNGIAPHFSRTLEYSYIVSGVRNRAAWKLVSSNQTNLGTLFESAFDGKSINTYSGDNRYFTTGAEQPGALAESDYSPLTALFVFLTKSSDVSQSCRLRFADIIDKDITKKLIPTITEISNGVITISIAGLPKNGSPTMWKVFLDAEGDKFTPKMIIFDMPGKCEEIFKLLDYTNLGNYYFPRRMECVASSLGASPSLLFSVTVTLVSISIPDKIDDSVFTLEDEKKTANVVWNRDQKKLIKEGPRIQEVTHETARKITILLILLTTIFIPAAILAWKKLAENKQN
jgi:hypothetical protein